MGVLLEAGTAYPSRAPVFTPGFWWGPCCSSFLVYCVMFFCFVCIRLESRAPIVASFYGLFILDCPPVFSNVYFVAYCLSFWLLYCLSFDRFVDSNYPLGIFKLLLY